MDPVLDAALLAAIQEDTANRNQDFITGGIAPTEQVGTGALDAILQTTNALTGSNFDTRQLQQTNNQIAKGNAQGLELAGADNDILKKEIELQAAAEKAEAKAQNDALDLELKREKQEIAKRKADRDDQIAQSRIAKNNAQAAKALGRTGSGTTTPQQAAAQTAARVEATGGVPQQLGQQGAGQFTIAKSDGFTPFINGLINKKLDRNKAGGTTAQRFKISQDKLKRLSKSRAGSENLGRARNVLAGLTDPNGVNPAGIGGISTALAKAGGETGVLTDADIGRFKGSQSLVARYNRAVKQYKDGTLTDQDQEELGRLAASYVRNARAEIAKEIKATAAEFRGEFAVTNDELLFNGFVESTGGQFTAEELELIAREEATPEQVDNFTSSVTNIPGVTAAPAQPAAETIDEKIARLRGGR